MTSPNFKERTKKAQSKVYVHDGVPGDGSVVPQSLPLGEIESLLRMARENVRQQVTEVQDEVLGPGDVQYLRGNSMSHMTSSFAANSISGPTETAVTPDSLLQQAERHLTDAILNSGPEQPSSIPLVRDGHSNRIQTGSRLTPRQGLTLEDLGDVDLDISIELGRAEILIEEVLKLREGSVVSLDKLAGDPVDIVANGRLVARGELLVVDGKFGVRLSEVL